MASSNLHRVLAGDCTAKTHFDPKFSSQASSVELTNDNRTLRHIGSTASWVTVMADFLINGQHEIDLHINGIGTDVMLGVKPADAAVIPVAQYLGQNATIGGWALYSHNGTTYSFDAGNKTYASSFGANTLVTIVVNCDLHTLAFKVGGVDKGVAFTHPKLTGPLKFGVSIYQPNDSVTIRRVTGPKSFLTPDIPGLGDGSLWKLKYDYISQTRESLNILMIGAIGAGKSSFINTLLTAFPSADDNEISSLCLVFGSDAGHVTKSISSFSLGCNTIKLVDPWGWTDINYDLEEFSALLEGRIGPGFVMGTGLSRGTLGVRAFPNVNHQIHGIIFFLDTREAQSTSSTYAKRLKHFLNIALNRDYRPVMVMTKIDLVDETLATAPQTWIQSSEVLMARTNATAASGLAMNEIFPCKSYHNEYVRSKNTEAMPLMALEAVVRRAKVFREKQLKFEGEQETRTFA